ncbi:MAG: hypothetical protein KC620_06235, partial [Myxococcales bacterium]|nr:hypothetical protein [Myxococcales bacterium]
GGGGGGGQGGASFDIFVAPLNGLNPDYLVTNIFDLDGDVPTGGPAGQGGNSSAPLVGQGNAGSDGPAGNLGGLP